MPPQALSGETGMPQLSPEAIETLQTLSLRVRPPNAAERVWKRLFSERERAILGGDLPSAWSTRGTIGMWAQVKEVSQPRALIELSEAFGWLNAPNRDWLLREIGEQARAAPLPTWNSATGELTLDGEVVRRVAVRASNIRPILDAFQEERWIQHIDDPLRGGPNAKRLHRTLEMLNEGLTGIKFSSDGAGLGVTWRHR